MTRSVLTSVSTGLVMLLLASWASAECAWVLWATPIKSDPFKPEARPQWRPVDTFPTEVECKKLMAMMIGKWGEPTETACFPDTVDPRGPKGK